MYYVRDSCGLEGLLEVYYRDLFRTSERLAGYLKLHFSLPFFIEFRHFAVVVLRLLIQPVFAIFNANLKYVVDGTDRLQSTVSLFFTVFSELRRS